MEDTAQNFRLWKQLKSTHYTHWLRKLLGKYMHRHNKATKKKEGVRKKKKLQISKMTASQAKRTGTKCSKSAISLAWTSPVLSMILGDSVIPIEF